MRGQACALVAAAWVGLLLLASGASAAADALDAGAAGRAQVSGPTAKRAWIANLVTGADARRKPGRGRVVMRVRKRARWNGGPVGLLVLASREARDGSEWLKVRLPKRPNGRSGWIPADVARLETTPWRIVIRLRKRRVVVRKRGRVRFRTRAVIGAPLTPTPRGLFAVAERVKQPDPKGFLGPWALLVTGYSDTLRRFDGGPGQTAIHGRDGASLADPLGSARSRGCVRIRNQPVRRLARIAREGTPVKIRR